jgi:8-oxo-dGTP pyrophosphatase MutT (NUDIX family)
MKTEAFIQGDIEQPVFPEYHQLTNTIVRWGEKVLLVRRLTEPFRDHWSVPGGGVEPGETYLQAALRELSEETGITAEAVNPLYIFADHAYKLESHIFEYISPDGFCRNREMEEHDLLGWYGIPEAL